MRSVSVAISLVALLITSCSSAPQQNSPATVRPADEVVRSFFIAMLMNDEAGVRKEILPSPDAQVLWQGSPPPAEALSQIKKQLEAMTCRECKVGETIDLPGNKTLTVTDYWVNENSKLLFPIIGGEPMPTPLPVLKVDGQWKVEAGPLIAARLAEEHARQKQGP